MPKCGKPLMLRESKRGPFLSCSGYPACKEAFNIDPAGNPVAVGGRDRSPCARSAASRWRCGRLTRGVSRLHGVSQVPQHRAGGPTRASRLKTVKVEVKCEKCGGPMGVKQRPPGRISRLP